MNYRWRLAIGIALISVVAYIWLKQFPEKDTFSPRQITSNIGGAQEILTNDDPKKKYEKAISQLMLTEKEAAAQPQDLDKASWFATIFFTVPISKTKMVMSSFMVK